MNLMILINVFLDIILEQNIKLLFLIYITIDHVKLLINLINIRIKFE